MKRKKTSKNKARDFWEAEYSEATHLQMSHNPSSDLEAFMRWLMRQKDETHRLVGNPQVLDIACGNGRNSLLLEKKYQATVFGFDVSSEAISQAQKNTKYKDNFRMHALEDMPYPYKTDSMDLLLDMMSSHVLNSEQRKALREEKDRILRPGGWIFYKTFLLDGDRNAREMIEQQPGDEKGSYVHPRIGHMEYTLTVDQIIEEIEAMGWIIHKISKSHRHVVKGRAAKRRTISLYIQKPYDW